MNTEQSSDGKCTCDQQCPVTDDGHWVNCPVHTYYPAYLEHTAIQGGQDRKFKFENGQFVNRVSGEAIPLDEPIIIFRARDKHAVKVLQYYHFLAQDEHHQQAIRERLSEFMEFSKTHSERMKEPGVTRHISLSSNTIPHILSWNTITDIEDEALCSCGWSSGKYWNGRGMARKAWKQHVANYQGVCP